MSVLDMAGIRGLPLVSDKCFEQHEPAGAVKRRSPVEGDGRLSGPCLRIIVNSRRMDLRSSGESSDQWNSPRYFRMSGIENL